MAQTNETGFRKNTLREKVAGLRYVGESACPDKNRVIDDLRSSDRPARLLHCCGSTDDVQILISSIEFENEASKKRGKAIEGTILINFNLNTTDSFQPQIHNVKCGDVRGAFGEAERNRRVGAFLLIKELINGLYFIANYMPRMPNYKNKINHERLSEIRRQPTRLGFDERDIANDEALEKIRFLAKADNHAAHRQCRTILDSLFTKEANADPDFANEPTYSETQNKR